MKSVKEKLKVEYVDIGSIRPYALNAKEHPKEQIEQIKDSIRRVGFLDPIGVCRNEIVEGHGRYIAAQELGFEKVPVIRLDELTDAERRFYTLVHNKTTMNSGFDHEILSVELESLGAEFSDIDLSFYGFEIGGLVDEDEVPTSDSTSFHYVEQYGIIVMCRDEAEQEKIYNELASSGYTCKVVAT